MKEKKTYDKIIEYTKENLRAHFNLKANNSITVVAVVD